MALWVIPPEGLGVALAETGHAFVSTNSRHPKHPQRALRPNAATECCGSCKYVASCISQQPNKSSAQLCRLCDFQGVRNVMNFRLGYLNGYFAGTPFPAL